MPRDDSITGPHRELALRFRAALKARNLTVNAAADRYEFSREALTRFHRGKAVQAETVERWAEAIGEDVNEWRQAAGLKPVQNTIHKIWEAARRVAAATGEDIRLSWSQWEALANQDGQVADYEAMIRRGLAGNP